eukprot:749343-Hanusia_phi.AAC.10
MRARSLSPFSLASRRAGLRGIPASAPGASSVLLKLRWPDAPTSCYNCFTTEREFETIGDLLLKPFFDSRFLSLQQSCEQLSALRLLQTKFFSESQTFLDQSCKHLGRDLDREIPPESLKTTQNLNVSKRLLSYTEGLSAADF